MELNEVLHRLLRLADAAGRLHADLASGLLVNVADRLEHHERDREGAAWGSFPVEVLMKSGARGHRKQARRTLS